MLAMTANPLEGFAMGSLKWFKRDPRAAVLGMMTLTLEERGAYNTLIDLIYIADGALPDNANIISRLLGTNTRRWKRIRASLINKGKIYLIGGRLHNERADLESADAMHRVAKRKAWRRSRKAPGNGLANHSGNHSGNHSRVFETPIQLDQTLSALMDSHSHNQSLEVLRVTDSPQEACQVKRGKTWISGITLRGAAVVSISAAVALVIVLGGPGVRQDVANRVAAPETPAAENNAPMSRAVRTVPITAQPLPTWPTTASAVTEAPAPTNEGRSRGSFVETPAAPARAANRPRQVDDVCQRHGGYRENYQRGRWPAWRCVFPKKG